MLTGTQDMTRLEIIEWMTNNNDCVELDNPTEPYYSSLISHQPVDKLSLPYGWSCIGNCLTNKRNSSTGISHCIKIIFP